MGLFRDDQVKKFPGSSVVCYMMWPPSRHLHEGRTLHFKTCGKQKCVFDMCYWLGLDLRARVDGHSLGGRIKGHINEMMTVDQPLRIKSQEHLTLTHMCLQARQMSNHVTCPHVLLLSLQLDSVSHQASLQRWLSPTPPAGSSTTLCRPRHVVSQKK